MQQLECYNRANSERNSIGDSPRILKWRIAHFLPSKRSELLVGAPLQGVWNGAPAKLVIRNLMKRLIRVLAFLLILGTLPAIATDKAKAFYRSLSVLTETR